MGVKKPRKRGEKGKIWGISETKYGEKHHIKLFFPILKRPVYDAYNLILS